jgi:hypothetical protein
VVAAGYPGVALVPGNARYARHHCSRSAGRTVSVRLDPVTEDCPEMWVLLLPSPPDEGGWDNIRPAEVMSREAAEYRTQVLRLPGEYEIIRAGRIRVTWREGNCACGFRAASTPKISDPGPGGQRLAAAERLGAIQVPAETPS